MYFKPGKFTYSLITWSLLSLLWMSEFHPYTFLAVLFAAISFFYQEKVHLSFKGQAGVVTAALLLCFVCTRTLDHTEVGRFLGIGTMSLAVLGATLSGCFLVLKREGPLVRGLLLSASGTLIACSLSSDLISVAVVTGVGLLLTILAYREAQGLSSSWRLVPPVLITFALLTTLAVVATWSETRLSYLASLFQLTPPTGFSFPVATSLRSLQKHSGDDIVVLRGYGADPPTYLVGRTFTQFDQSSFWRWETTKKLVSPQDQILVETPQGPRAVSLFNKSDDPNSKPGSAFRLEYPKAGRGYTLYSPRHGYGIAADITRLNRYGDGMLQVEPTESIDGNYYLVPFLNGWRRQSSPDPADTELLSECLQTPEGLTPVVEQLAREVAGKTDDPAQKAAFITSYLQQNYTYGYDYPFESSHTALEEFLTKKPPAHCEFFATAGALMMRSQGIPTRYINGFVLQERSLSGDYYVIRLKHAHAWLEAYIPGQGWVTFDPTPPGTLGTPENRSSLGSSLLELFSNLWRKFFGFFSLSPQEMLERVKEFLTGLSWWDYTKLLALGAIWFLWKRFRGRKKKMCGQEPYRYEAPRHQRLTPLLEEVMSELEPDLRRQPSETVRQWSNRLEDSGLHGDTCRTLAGFVESYNRARYRTGVTDEAIQHLQSEAEGLASRLKGTSLEARERR